MKITHMKTVINEVAWGEVEVKEVNDSYEVYYHNKIYKGSPFKLSNSFSTSFTIDEVLDSDEVNVFLSRFNG